jgi:hypothetical protein
VAPTHQDDLERARLPLGSFLVTYTLSARSVMSVGRGWWECVGDVSGPFSLFVFRCRAGPRVHLEHSRARCGDPGRTRGRHRAGVGWPWCWGAASLC